MKSKTSRGGSGSGFKYHPRSSEEVQKRATQQGGQFDSIFRSGVDRWRAKDGENVIRILPPTWEDHDHYGLDIWVHSFVGPDKSTYLCPNKMKSEPCPICKAARDAKAAGEEDEAKALGATRRVLVWIIDRDDEKSTPSLYDMSWSMDRDIAALCHNKRTGKVLLIDHPDQGYDIMFTRTGKGLNTRYIGMAVDRQDSPIMSDEGEQDKVLEYIQENPLPDVLNFYDEDYLKRMIEGGTDERDEELDDGEADAGAPRGRAARTERRSAASPRRRPAEEDEVEEEVDEAPPARGRARPRDEPAEDDVVEEDEVEEDEVEEEVDEAPPPRRAASDRPTRAGGSRRPAPDDDADAPPSRTRPTSRRAAPADDEIEEADIDDGVEEEVDEAPPPRRAAGKPGRFSGRSRR